MTKFTLNGLFFVVSQDDSDKFESKPVVASGWGTRNPDKIDLPSILNMVELKTTDGSCGQVNYIVEQPMCNNFSLLFINLPKYYVIFWILFQYSPDEITENMLCSFAPGKDACQGDSGGTPNYLTISVYTQNILS